MFMPRKIKKIIRLLRGQVSPLLAGLSVGLGFWFGLMPGFYGIHALLLVILLLLNIPIGLFILFIGIGKAISLAIAPLLYHSGNFIAEHLSGIITLFGKIPIAGMSDFSHPALVGGLLLGPILGILVGFGFGQMILGFRKTWLKLEENTEKFNAWYNKGWVKLVDRIVIGKRGAKDARQALEARSKLFRKAGVALAAILLVILLVISMLFQKQVVRKQAVTKLSQANGATVDIKELNLSPFSGTMELTGLGVADRENLNKNAVQVGQASARANVYQMSLGKLVMEQVKVSDVTFGQTRPTPGALIASDAASSDSTDTQEPGRRETPDVNGTDLQQYLNKYEDFKAWLEKIKPWLPQGKDADAPEETPHKYLDYLFAKGGPEAAVRMLAKEIILEKVLLSDKQFGSSTLQFTNLNDAPQAAKLPIGMRIDSEQGPSLEMQMHFDDPETPGKVSGSFAAFDLSKLQSDLKSDNAVQFQSGLASGTLTGAITRDWIDLTVSAKLTDLQASAQGGLFGLDANTTRQAFEMIKELDATLNINGPLSDPKVSFAATDLKQQILDASKQRLLKEVDDQIKNKAPEEVQELLKDDGFRKGLEGLMKGTKSSD
ncbi:hypothetical protein ACFL6U_13555 [Planctomycetota bacterium]